MAIYKIYLPNQFDNITNYLPYTQLDITSNYLHLCTNEQIKGVLTRFFNLNNEIIILELPSDLGIDLKYEPVKEDNKVQLFPHFYGKIDKKMVLRRWLLNKKEEKWNVVEGDREIPFDL